jgi:hypothetical protein
MVRGTAQTPAEVRSCRDPEAKPEEARLPPRGKERSMFHTTTLSGVEISYSHKKQTYLTLQISKDRVSLYKNRLRLLPFY